MGPEILIIAAIATSATATAISYSAARQQAESQKGWNKYNAAVAKRDAEARERAGKAKVEELQLRRNRLLSSMRADRAKSGVTKEGSPLLKEIETAELMTLDALTEGYNTRVGVQQKESEAELYRMKAKSATREGRLMAGQSLFSGASNILSLGYQYQKDKK